MTPPALLLATALALGAAQGGMRDEIERFREAMGEAYGAMRESQWDVALDIAATVQAEARALVDAAPPDAGGLREVSEYGASATWLAARSEHQLARTQAALDRLNGPAARWPDAAPGYRSLALTLQASLLIDLGLPDLTPGLLESALALCAEERASGAVRNWGAYVDAHATEIQRHMAIGRFRDALAACDAAESGIDWTAAAARVTPAEAERLARQLRLLRAAAWVELAVEDPAAGVQARSSLEALLAERAMHPLDAFTTRTKLVQLELHEGRLDQAAALLQDLRRSSPGELARLPLEERVWLATLEAQLARRQESGREAAKAALRGQFDRLGAEWRKFERPGGVGFLRYRRVRAALIELLIDGSEAEALETLIRCQTMGVLWRALGEPAPSAAEVRRTLCAQDTGCLVFVSGIERTLLIAFDGSTILRRDDLPGFAWIEPRQRELANALRVVARGDADPSGRWRKTLEERPRELASALLPAPVRELVGRWKRVRLVGRDLLADVPLQILPVFDGRPLGTTHALSDLPSLPVGVALAQRRVVTDDDALRVSLLAAPLPAKDVVADFPILDRKVLEASHFDDLREALGRDLVEVHLGAAATLGRFAKARLVANVLHVVAHGLIDVTRELRPMLALTPDELAADGLLTVERARATSVPALVFLSACRTADGVDRFGDAGASHLGGALLQAGASSVVVSDEDLQLGDALVLARAFYAHCEPSAGPAEALRAARAELYDESAGVGAWGLAFVFGLGD